MKACSRHTVGAAQATERSTGLRIVGRWGASALATTGLLALAEPPWGLWPLAGAALAPWLVWVVGARAWPALLGSASVGIAFGCASAPWGPAALRGLGATPAEAVAGFLLGAAWVKGLPFAAVGFLVNVARHRSAWVRVAVAGAAFLGVDWVHSSWRAGVPWALLGHSQADALGVAQLAAVGGVPLLSGFLAAINQAVAIAWEARGSRKSLRPLASLVAAWATMALVGLPVARAVRSIAAPAGVPEVTLLLVQPDVPRGERWAENLQASHLAKIARQTERALGEPGPKPDVVLWPENLLTAPIDRSPELGASLQATVDRLGVPVILGAVRGVNGSDPDLYRSSVLWLAPGRGTVAAIDKTRAFPLLEAESSSRGAALVARAFGGAARWKKVEEPLVPMKRETPARSHLL